MLRIYYVLSNCDFSFRRKPEIHVSATRRLAVATLMIASNHGDRTMDALCCYLRFKNPASNVQPERTRRNLLSGPLLDPLSDRLDEKSVVSLLAKCFGEFCISCHCAVEIEQNVFIVRVRNYDKKKMRRGKHCFPSESNGKLTRAER